MADIKITAQQMLPDIFNALDLSTVEKVFPHVAGALDEIAKLYYETWIGFASGVPIPGTPRVINSRGTYKKSIQVNLSSPSEKVVYSDSILNKYIEEGSDAVDLKEGLLKGPHVKYGKNGPYNVVAFRHGVPGSVESSSPMPLRIFTLSQKASEGRRPTKRANKDFEVISQDNRIGIRSKRVESFMPGKGNYTWKSGKYAGMRKQDTSTGKAKRSQYITFRTVSTASDPASWIRPPQAGIPIREQVVETAKEIAIELLRDAIVQDLQ